MNAIKGCINQKCKATNKIRYKKDDLFCSKCGEKLCYVCAECWKPMEKDTDRYCISCQAIKEQKKEQIKENAKKAGQGAVVAMGAVAGAVKIVGEHADDIAKGAKKAVDAGAKIIKMVKK